MGYRRRVQHRPAKMRTYDDTFSATKIYPGKGKLYVRGDSKIFRFQNGKTESLFLQRKNPRRIAWTMLYRRMHKKGISEEVAKKRTRRTVKHQRAIVGATLDVIKERRAQRPEARQAARQAAIKESKEKKAAKTATGQVRGGLASKQQAKGKPGKVQATSDKRRDDVTGDGSGPLKAKWFLMMAQYTCRASSGRLMTFDGANAWASGTKC